jgi:LCP family protein required for cell wall assembly
VRTSREIEKNKIDLVSARSQANADVRRFSRKRSAEGYAKTRRRRALRKRIILGSCVTLAALLIASTAAFGFWVWNTAKQLGINPITGTSSDFSAGIFDGVFVEPAKPEDPFWMLLLGTDGRLEGEAPRSDTMILVRINPAEGTAAMVSIPRDTMVEIPGVGTDKINAAYHYGEMEESGGGAALAIRTVSEFAGVDIAYFAQVDFSGFQELVDDVGGVEVNVMFDIIGDGVDADGATVYSGVQVLNGAQAFSFCQSREFGIGDYQRQANQRVFLQAFAKKVLSSDLPTIATTVGNLASMTYTNMDLQKIINVASSLQGMTERSIHTYTVPSYTDLINEISYVIADDGPWRELISELNAGRYPAAQESYLAGETPAEYQAESSTPTTDQLGGAASDVDTAKFVIDVRNGYGIEGSATGVSDMLSIAGYKRGEIGNASSFVYEETIIVYRDESDKGAANDIRARLGYGRVIASLGRYAFEGNVLVVVGGDFPTPG